jgi:hypothetical protein
MDGFKDSTKVKYMCGGPVKKATGGVVKKFDGGGVYNERGKRATAAEVAAEGRRVEGRKPPVEGISSRPTDSSGRRMTNAELGMTPGGVSPAKKAPAKSMNSMAELGALAAKKKKAVPAHSDRPMIRLPIPRSKGGLMAMPKGK